MGGTFDPIHYGHLILAEQARECYNLDKVIFVTAADPPHKNGLEITPVMHRRQMACIAVNGNERFEHSTIEIDRPGPSYTIDTLRQIVGTYGDSISVYLLVGADEAAALMDWREPYEIQKLATIAVANRPGQSIESALGGLPDDFARHIAPLQMPGVDISSTNLRERVRCGRSIKYLVPDAVEQYILNKKLYRG